MDPLTSGGNIGKATFYVVLSSLMFAFSGAETKFLSANIAAVPLLFWRNFFVFLIFMIFMIPQGDLFQKTKKFKFHILRSLFSYVGTLAYFYTANKLSLTNSIMFMSTWPIFIPLIALLAYRRLSDLNVWRGVAVGIAGMVLMISPGKMGLGWGEASGVASGFLGGAAMVAIWAMSATESPRQQMFYFSLLSLIFSMILLPVAWYLPTLNDLVVIVGIAFFNLLAQYWLAKGCSFAPTDKIMTWSYVSIVFAALIGFFGWHEEIDPLALFGMVLIVVGARWTATKPSSSLT